MKASQLTNHKFPIDADGVIFSKGTYQVRFIDPLDRVEYWPFFHLDDSGKILESFCSCDQTNCLHIPLAYQFLTKRGKPLHVLFEQSLYHKMGYDFFLYSQIHPHAFLGYKENSFCFANLFTMELFSKQVRQCIYNLFDNRPQQTEETSLKFTHLSEKELELFKQGKPSKNLQFELSIFRDLGALWFVKSYIEEPEAIFSFDKQNIPNLLTIHFKDAALCLFLDHKLIERWCEYFASLKANLFVKTMHLESIFYNEEQKQLELNFTHEKEEVVSEKLENFGQFDYLPRKGFIAKALTEKTIKNIEGFLLDHGQIVQSHLQNVAFEESLTEVRYDLEFTNTHFLIKPYLFEKGDLQKAFSHLFGTYAYIEKKGFYRIDEVFQNQTLIKVPLEKMAEFITLHRSFFQQQKGFALHQHQVESALDYQVTENGSLQILPKIYSKDHKTLDLGSFVYVHDMGFFRKGAATNIAKTLVPRKLVDDFIKRNIDELATIENFFCQSSPIEDMGLDVVLKASKIIVSPNMTLKSGMNPEDILLYDRFGYLKNQGFFERTKFLPEKYRTKKIIQKEQIPSFLRHELFFLMGSIKYLDPRLKKISPSQVEIIDLAYLNERGLWLIKAIFRLGEKKLMAAKVAQSHQEQNQIFFTALGYFDLKESIFSWLDFLEGSYIEQDRFFLTTLALLRLLTLGGFLLASELAEEKKALIHELFSFETKTKPNLDGFQAKLRSYQTTGLNWLWFLHERDLSGLLCDDMGLGKTHQVLAFAAALYNLGKKPFLVVCPTSVLYHWEELLKTVLPHLKVCIYHGLRRNLTESFDIVLTTYGILRRGDALLNQYFFQLAIFDEMQIAKNIRSQTNKALKALNCKIRIGLSGTPVENRLLELKSLFDIALPLYLPKEDVFNELFVYPIEKANNKEQMRVLQELIKPFVLRRKKSDVLKDLPKKIEQRAHCELIELQKKLYIETTNTFYAPIEKELQDDTKAVPFLSIFSLLTKLKMICNHPALYLKDEKNYAKYPSGKWELFKELIHEALNSEQKVVVFTQYLGMLDIIKRYLANLGIGYASIQGATQNRAEELKRFKEDIDCKVFVGSLRAVGLGVDLSTASVVIHYDRWWNPAWENQATDRVHRIGQKRGVQVFKIITKDTIEEKIDELIERKMRLMSIVQAQKTSDVIKTFTKADWIELLQTLKKTI